MNTASTEYKKDILNLYFKKLKDKYKVDNVELSLENQGSVYESMFIPSKKKIIVTGIQTSNIRKLLWVLTHEFRHAQQFQKPMKIHQFSKIKMIIFMSLLAVNWLVIHFNPQMFDLLRKVGMIQILFIGHFLESKNHENNSIFLELDADNFANKEIGGGAIDLNEATALYRSFGCLFLNIIGFQTHPIFYTRYKKSLQHPFKQDILFDLECELDQLKKN